MLPRAKDLMVTPVVTVSPETPLIEVHRLLSEERIGGVPAIDDAGNVVGVITAADLLRAVSEEHDSGWAETEYFREVLPDSSPDWSGFPEDFHDRLGELRVSDYMTEGVISVSPDATAPRIAHELRESRVHRVFVCENGRLLGVVSAFDLLRLVEDWKESR